jgi:hypothetical protein
VADWQDGVDTVKYVVQLHLPLQSFARMWLAAAIKQGQPTTMENSRIEFM